MDDKTLGLVLVFAIGCGSSGEGSDGGSTEGTTADGDSTGGDMWPPAACDLDASPFLDAECLDALRLGCNQQMAEGSCTGFAPALFDGYTIRCGWVEVFTFSDATTCALASTTSRCEAYIDQECPADCSAIPSEGEILELCGGPIGPWSAVDSEQAGYVGTCAPNVQPPAPALCDCAPASCVD